MTLKNCSQIWKCKASFLNACRIGTRKLIYTHEYVRLLHFGEIRPQWRPCTFCLILALLPALSFSYKANQTRHFIFNYETHFPPKCHLCNPGYKGLEIDFLESLLRFAVKLLFCDLGVCVVKAQNKMYLPFLFQCVLLCLMINLQAIPHQEMLAGTDLVIGNQWQRALNCCVILTNCSKYEAYNQCWWYLGPL